MRILLSGGGTGGHVYPLLAVVSRLRTMTAPDSTESRVRPEGSATDSPVSSGEIRQALLGENSPVAPWPQPGRAPEPLALRQRNGGAREALLQPSAVELLYAGQAGSIEESLAARAGIPFRPIETGQIRGLNPLAAARNLARMSSGVAQSRRIIADFRPDVLLMTGGYVSVPVALSAWRAQPRVPTLIYLPDVTPGLAIRLTARIASRVAVSFAEVSRWFPGKAVVTGYPVRPELGAMTTDEARRRLSLATDVPVLLVFGGSRGARSINRAILASLEKLLQRCQIVHISGEADWGEVSQARTQLDGALARRYRPYPYLHEEMVAALAAADLVVARAGASTLGEFPAAALPSILVPYPYAGQHQEANAAYLADRGAAIIVHDDRLSAELASIIIALLDGPERLAATSAAARTLAQPEAAERIIATLTELATHTES